MNITIEELMTGQATAIRGKEYLTTEAYVKPFLDRINNADEILCRAIQPTQLNIGRNGDIINVFNKVFIEAVTYIDNNFAEVVGMTYAIDTRKPVCKFFTCLKENLDSGNFFINNSSQISYQEIEPESPIDFSLLDKIINNKYDVNPFIEKIKKIGFDSTNDEVNRRLGQWIRFAINFNITNEFGSIKIATNDIITGYKSIFEDKDSIFYQQLATPIDFFKIYKAMAKVVYENKDILNIPEKTLLLNPILAI